MNLRCHLLERDGIMLRELRYVCELPSEFDALRGFNGTAPPLQYGAPALFLRLYGAR